MTPPLPSVLSNSALPKLAVFLAKPKPCNLPHPPTPEARVSVPSPRVTYQSLTSNLLLSFGDIQFSSLPSFPGCFGASATELTHS